ncbi:MAG: PepSY domain-containing protein [Cyanosarcina radialis HA8281-LM2]|nr:PepSY domain-containing protein [Cyanosarcina radialis HA8281-LM2]
MIRRKRQISKLSGKLDRRSVHRILAPIIFLPLTVSAITGITYRLGKSWFGLSKDRALILLQIHQGSYFGSFFRPIYVLLVGLGLVAMLITGINMISRSNKHRQKPKESSIDREH